MDKVRIGILGAYRGTSMINYCEVSKNAKVVAICDKSDVAIETQKENLKDPDITYYKDFEDFIKHDMDAVVLANYANEHAPFAIRCMNEGKHVFSEVLPVQTMKEAVELVETVEKTGKIYAYGENYCYMPGTYEMKKMYEQGIVGELEYADAEYIHNCAPIWASITYGEHDHWRNNMTATYYCTHSIGPIIHCTGLRPVSVIGVEGTNIKRGMSIGRRSGQFGMEIITLENKGIIRSTHGGLFRDSLWYSIYGDKGRMETAREDSFCGGVEKIYLNSIETAAAIDIPIKDKVIASFGHSGSDYHCMDNFVRKIQGDPTADIIDVYEALDMALPGLFAYRSILNNHVAMDIPNLRNKEERDKWRNDTMCTDKKVAGDMYVPPFSGGEVVIPDEVYDEMKRQYEADLKSQDGYAKMAFTQGQIKTDKKGK